MNRTMTKKLETLTPRVSKGAMPRKTDAADKVLASLAIWWSGSYWPLPKREHRVCPHRNWRFDLAWPALKCAVEVHGGVHTGGRHVRGKGFERDREKVNVATLLGWRVLEFSTAEMFERDGKIRGAALEMIEALVQCRDVNMALVRWEQERKAKRGGRRPKKAAKKTKAKKVVS